MIINIYRKLGCIMRNNWCGKIRLERKDHNWWLRQNGRWNTQEKSTRFNQTDGMDIKCWKWNKERKR